MKLGELVVTQSSPGTLSSRFDPSSFSPSMSGELEFTFNTELAPEFLGVLAEHGAKTSARSAPSAF